jgi:hypothetical protein
MLAFVLAGCEVGTTTAPKSPYRAPTSGNSGVVSGSSAEVATATTVTVTVKDKGGYGIPNVVPTITAVDSLGASTGITSGGCGMTNSKGVSVCSITSTRAATFTIKTVTPVATTGNTITFYQVPRSLSFTVQPACNASGVKCRSIVDFSTMPQVQLKDKAGTNIDTTTTLASSLPLGNVTLSLTTAGGATLNGTKTSTPGVTGLANTFALLDIDLVGTYTLTASYTDATAGTITKDDTTSLQVIAGAASKFKYVTQPSTTASTGVAFTTQPVVAATDASGNAITDSTDAGIGNCQVKLALTVTSGEAGDALGSSTGTTPTKTMVSTTSGYQSSFSAIAVKVNRIGTTLTPLNYVLTASGVAATTCAAFTSVDSDAISVSMSGVPYKLGLVQAPSTAALNESWATQPIIEVLDLNGNRVTSDNTTQVTIAIASGPTGGSGTLTGSKTLSASSGLITYSGLSIVSANAAHASTATNPAVPYNYTFSGIYPGLTITSLTGITQTITSNGLTPSKLAFYSNPSNVAIAESQTIKVKVLDANGYLCANDNTSTVKIKYDNETVRAGSTLGSGGGAMLQNGAATTNDAADGNRDMTAAVTAINGIATFNGISFTTANAKQLLAFGTSGVASPAGDILSTAFSVANFTTVDHLKFTTQPGDTDVGAGDDAGGNWTTQPVVMVKDKYDNTVTSDNSTVITLDCVAPITTPACTLAGNYQMTVTNGVATFTNIRLANDIADVNGVMIRARGTATGGVTPLDAYADAFKQDN